LAAYLFWGFAPVYFVWVSFAHPLEVLAHRIVWSLPLLAVLITLARQWPALRALTPRQLSTLVLCSVLLSINWLTFVYAVQSGRIAETALGYFINPLVSIVLGWMFLRERLRRWQWVAAGIAAAGVGGELLLHNELPWLGLLLAGSFGVYGLLRRQLAIPSSVGLGVEASIVAPLAVTYLIYAAWANQHADRSLEQLLMLGLGGAVTVTPLVWFAAAAIRLPLATLGFFQYIAPSLSLLLAIFVYAEPVSTARWGTFILIWSGLIVFSVEGLVHHRRR
jgi:chloramphenicol-sensitive protein RarD